MLWLIITIAFGASFVYLEIAEFIEMIDQGAGPQASGYLSSFFTLVSTHGFHVSLGMIGIVMMVLQVLVKGITPQVRSRLFRLGLFWHFLDIVIPFWVVWSSAFPAKILFTIVALCALVQVLVHLRFFLNISFKHTEKDYMTALLFSGVLIFIMAGGTIWILYDLNFRMM